MGASLQHWLLKIELIQVEQTLVKTKGKKELLK